MGFHSVTKSPGIRASFIVRSRISMKYAVPFCKREHWCCLPAIPCLQKGTLEAGQPFCTCLQKGTLVLVACGTIVLQEKEPYAMWSRASIFPMVQKISIYLITKSRWFGWGGVAGGGEQRVM